MKKRLQISTLLFYLITAFMVATSIFCLVNAISWINKPFAGMLLYKPPFVGSMGNREWQGFKAGLGLLDRIVTADGKPIWSGRDLENLIKEKKPGPPVHYRIESKGEIREVTVPVDVFELKDFLLVFGIPFLGGLALYVLGFTVFVLKSDTSTSWVFFLLCFFLGSYMVTGFDLLTDYYTLHFHSIVFLLYPAAFFHLGLIFPDRKQILTRFPAFEYLIYIPALILCVAFQIYLFNYKQILGSNALPWLPTYKGLSSFARIFSLFGAASLIVLVFLSYFRAATVLSRSRARLILFGVTMAFLPSGLIMLLMNITNVNFPWNFLVFFVIFFPASIAYSIVRHNLFDADEIIKRTVGYFIVTAIVIGAYAIVSILFNVFFGQYQLAHSRAFPILFTLGVILVFNPLRDRIQSLVDRIFFRKDYDYGIIVEKVSGAMTSLLDLPQILKQLTQTLIEDMFINTSSVMLLNPAGTEYKVYLADGENKNDVEQQVIKKDAPIIEIIEGTKKELTKYDVLENPQFREVSENCNANFESLHASLMVPLVYQDQVIGSLNLGEKKSGKFYNREDIDLLRTLAHQGAVAIENARLFQENLEKQRMEEELNIARDLQMSMLPAECPTIKGLDIAAYSVSAREVGGDFYDFIHMGEEKVGFVIADVTGKSVSGALVMSASRSVFRMLSEEHLSVSESMIRANRRLKKDVKTGMFVALLFAVMDSQSKTLTLCSAGQTQPVHVSAKTGEAVLVNTRGDTFPLGIIEDAAYEETQLKLEPGDRVVLYTDGIVEAMNEKEEMFGFEQLQEVVKEARSMSADELLKKIIDRVNEFAGDTPQHDDLTVIVLGVGD